MKLVYNGKHDEVIVPEAGNLVAVRGEPVEVEDKDVAARLVAQGWSRPSGRTAKEDADR